ncbi:Hypothetical predicted protein [Mytilus galloprovincialis]|uniref:Reverse transcriptase domain-containing protein n=1 Tax=Mytilus galloprovincialis TaxID=29158 RepID=A0A8B6ESW0_MYTGA|nr:Hypothetical predicted protein [Mytilus galloprovincialis]
MQLQRILKKAFLHIELDVDDRDVTRFYWLENPMDTESRLITYRFKVVLFGATCSPFMLSATLMKHFRDNPSTTSTELQRNVYVDNVLTSFTDKQSLLKFYTESRKLLSEAGFNLRSWNSNSTELQNVAGRDKIGDNDDIVKILGMRWDRESDDLKFQQIEFMEKDKMITKHDNPADYLTRGIYAKHLYNNSLWMNGPQWILNRENWPTWTRKIEDCSTMVTVSDDNTDDESTNASTQTISCIDIQRYRSLEKAIRVTAYVLRFIQNLRNSKDKRSIGFISVEERCKALKVLIVTVQQETFKDEIESLNSSSQKKVPLNISWLAKKKGASSSSNATNSWHNMVSTQLVGTDVTASRETDVFLYTITQRRCKTEDRCDLLLRKMYQELDTSTTS